MGEFENNAIFWLETEKIHPNPYQPRKEFDEHHLRDLAESIRMYGVLQPLVVTRQEKENPDGSIEVSYELIAGERRLRASRLAGVKKVPAVIRQGAENSRTKLELAIIENLQREDLNPVDRALAFARLVNEFSLKHTEVAKKVGKSREYVSNTLRLLVLPQDILDSLSSGKITEGHARTLMMLSDRKEEQSTLFKEIMFKKLTVREAEQVARHIAKDKVRKKSELTPEMEHIESQLAESLGTRVQIEPRQVGGGKIMIDFFSPEDLHMLLDRLQHEVSSLKMSTPPYMSKETTQEEAISFATPISVSAAPPMQPIQSVSAQNELARKEFSSTSVQSYQQGLTAESPKPEIQAGENKPTASTAPQAPSNSLALALGIPLSLIDIGNSDEQSMLDIPYDDRTKDEQESSMVDDSPKGEKDDAWGFTI